MQINQRYLAAICDIAAEYAKGIYRKLREHEYDPQLMRLYVVGGGSCILKNFGSYDKERVQDAYGEKYDSLMMFDSKRECILNDELPLFSGLFVKSVEFFTFCTIIIIGFNIQKQRVLR